MIADQPFMFQAVDDIRPGYRRSVYGTDCIYYQLMMIWLKLWRFWAVNRLIIGYKLGNSLIETNVLR